MCVWLGVLSPGPSSKERGDLVRRYTDSEAALGCGGLESIRLTSESIKVAFVKGSKLRSGIKVPFVSIKVAFVSQLKWRNGIKVPFESIRVTFESIKVAFESIRVTFESIRVAFESIRVMVESIRVTFESIRVPFASIRVAFESIRVRCRASSPPTPLQRRGEPQWEGIVTWKTLLRLLIAALPFRALGFQKIGALLHHAHRVGGGEWL